MSTCFSLYKKMYIPIKQTLEFVKSFGGYVVNNEDEYEVIPEDAIGIVERGNAIIWIYYRSDLDEFREDLYIFNSFFGYSANAVITVEHGKADETDTLARDFYLEFMKKYPDTYLLGRHNMFFNYDELSKFKITKDGMWEFLIHH